MYTQYFGLQEKPFAIAPNPRYLYMSELHKEALAHLLYGINDDGCLILLTGDVGTGKTTVCRCLLEQLPEDTDAAVILNPSLTVLELLQTICEELAIDIHAEEKSVKTYTDSLNRYLLTSHAGGRSTALIIDEAQNLSIDVLEQLRLLTNLETDQHKLLKIVLLGQTELQEMLSGPEVAQINQRITSRYHLGPLSRDDISVYVQHRLMIAGGGRLPLFDTKAFDLLYTLSGGIPRLINILCDRALLGAYVEGEPQVTKKIMAKAGSEVLGKQSARWRALLGLLTTAPGKIILTLLLMIVFGVGATLLFSPHAREGVTTRFRQLAHGGDMLQQTAESGSSTDDILLLKQETGQKIDASHRVAIAPLVLNSSSSSSAPTAANQHNSATQTPTETLISLKVLQNSLQLTPEAQRELDRFIATFPFERCRDVVVRGYAAVSTDPEENMRLAVARANEVKNYLVQHNFPPAITRATGMETRAPGSLDVRHENSRVEIAFTLGPQHRPIQ